MTIHKTAIIEDGADINANVEIGPYCIVGKNVKLGEGVKLHPHVVIDGITHIGQNTEIFPFASIGSAPQDLKYKGEKSRVIIGKNNVIREYTTINTGTLLGNMETVVGDNCLFMIGSHIAHDCIVGNNVILANNATLGGHVVLGDNVIIGGLAAVHQHVRIGKFAIIGGVSAVVNDVAPFASVAGDRARIIGINVVGMRRNNFSKESISAIRDVFKEIFYNQDKSFNERIEFAKNSFKEKESQDVIMFLESNQKRSVCMPNHQNGIDE
ncbi:acyl-ACP--UDP-N-acetylglucosamine O-acyltransferase [Candidatus Bandiella euplotis]|uniref:Acyl-[acyl-carrier-protein]--UDP-N-acetylglucosamine O-acyltransferase n=1 Tax=Candidatus Bandiella euplotis TaxID=1664265 RepID=A0ABZ0UL23_9RICK|nr:acyl-ACP--UDP-N-acetylglucosamine O-acyltransferase [Candidatus Bandiella woodruffii]WPX96424.1 Acyl-[acyl-carrier-protein]--UDP-N-acetylglucosamine O-acyltransferase [Candidatus Bandiella woodruffii]